ncbi:MAG: hypothetical protein JXB30_14320 [Anaerolineae bacterium]|nr:hypothetical protein [Anaerolineae bacterium]
MHSKHHNAHQMIGLSSILGSGDLMVILLVFGLLTISCTTVTLPGQPTAQEDAEATTSIDATPLPVSSPQPKSTVGIVIPGSTAGWLRTGIWLQAGDAIIIQASGTINIWPNCEMTKAGAGYPDLDCKEVTEIGPEGTLAFGPAKMNYPYPDGGVAALVGRIGCESLAFLMGTEGTFTASVDGFLQFAINDVESMEDNQDAFFVQVTIPYQLPQSIATVPWEDTGIILKPGDAFTITAEGTISMWPNCAATKVERGYPDIDCAETNVGPAGTDVFAPGLADYPLPGENTMTLIGRVGNDAAFVVGTGGDFVAKSGGPLLLVTNDTVDWKQDDQGMFSIIITVNGASDNVQLTIR